MASLSYNKEAEIIQAFNSTSIQTSRADISDQFRKVIMCYKRIGYNINVMRQSACSVINPIMVDNFVSLFNCTPVGGASDSMMGPI